MMLNPESYSSGHFRFNIKAVALGTMTVVAMVMLWWMYEEQRQIEKYSHVTPGDEAVMKRALEVTVHNLCSNENKSLQTVHTSEGKLPVQANEWDYNWDKRQWKKPADAQGVGVRTILLVRHGKYNLNTGHLDELGKAQANLTGVRLKKMGVVFSRLVHSSMARARETSQLIRVHLSQVSVEEDSLLIEGGPTQPDPTVSYWSLPNKDYYVDGPRLEAAFRKYFHRADKSQRQQTFELLVAHGNIFRYFVLRALQLNTSAWMRVFLAHGSITLLHVNPDGTVTLTKLGDSGHFPQHMVTF